MQSLWNLMWLLVRKLGIDVPEDSAIPLLEIDANFVPAHHKDH